MKQSQGSPGYIHRIYRLPQDPNMSIGKGPKSILDSFRERWSVITEFRDFMVTMKGWPYSDNDCMVIYSWANETISSLLDLSEGELTAFLEVTWHVAHSVEKDYKDGLNNGKYLLNVGINTSMIPGSGSIQSVRRPHFHVTLFAEHERDENNIDTKEVQINHEDTTHVERFCIRQSNFVLRDEFEEECQFIRGDRMHIAPERSGLYSLDFPIFDQENIASSMNRFFFMSIYRHAREFLSRHENWLRTESTGFSMAYVNEWGIWKIRVGFFEKEPTDSSWSAELSGHSLHRIETEDSMLLPNLVQFQERIRSVF